MVRKITDSPAFHNCKDGGGTRIGESLQTFNRWHAARVIHSRTVVMIVSDGYDTGEPELLSAQMRRLRQRCRRIIWLNPLIGWKSFSPEARGMQAALPYVDVFAPVHVSIPAESHGLDEARAFARPRRRDQLAGDRGHGNDVIAIDNPMGHPIGHREPGGRIMRLPGRDVHVAGK